MAVLARLGMSLEAAKPVSLFLESPALKPVRGSHRDPSTAWPQGALIAPA